MRLCLLKSNAVYLYSEMMAAAEGQALSNEMILQMHKSSAYQWSPIVLI